MLSELKPQQKQQKNNEKNKLSNNKSVTDDSSHETFKIKNIYDKVQLKYGKLKSHGPEVFKKFTGHDIECISSFENFTDFMYKPTDGASLGVARMLFGLTMMIDIPEERSGGELDYRWGEPRDCRFPLLPFLEPLSLPRMGIIYAIMWLGAFGIFLGYKFRISCIMFLLPYWYIFLLDKSSWNNHSYLYGLVGLLFLGTCADRFCSLDARRKKTIEETVPFWNYFILKYQFFLLYFLAGLKKFTKEWLSGYSMTNLSYHWVFAPFRLFLGAEMTDLLIIHWFGCIFDLTVAFWLIYKTTRPMASLFAAAFHLMNSRLFTIGMFPWLCLAELPLFYDVSWPRCKWLKKVKNDEKQKNEDSEDDQSNKIKDDMVVIKKSSSDLQVRFRGKSSKDEIKEPRIEESVSKEAKPKTKPTIKQKSVVSLLLFYCAIQAFLPYSHFITKGYNNWTNGLYGYSWDMMVHAWDTILVSVKVVDNENAKIYYLEPYAFSETDRWTKHADMAIQYAHCIKNNLEIGAASHQNAVLSPDNISIYFDIWCSLNGRFQQRIFNPTVDLLKANWSPFKQTEWVLPLLRELTYLRPQMIQITQEVLSWSNHSDILFIADFPGLFLENYISTDLDNITLTVLDGTVKLEVENTNSTVTIPAGQGVNIKSGVFHKIFVISDTPACYMYTYINRTLQQLNQNGEDEQHPLKQVRREKSALPLWDEFMHRWENFERFIVHVANSILFEVYSVPMPRRVKE